MNLKEELLKLKNKLLEKNNKLQNDNDNKEHPYKVLATHEELKSMEKQYYQEKNGKTSEQLTNLFSASLNDKVEEFIKWYKKNMYDDYFLSTPEEVRNFIEKMAVWYELRYPDYSVMGMLYGREIYNSSNQMFIENPYINKTNEELDILLENNKSREMFDYLEWDKFYNTRSFINSLPEDEKELLRKPRYFWSVDYNGASIRLTAKGTIENVRKFYFGPIKFDYQKLVGMNIKDALVILEKEAPHHDVTEIKNKIKDYDNQCKFKQDLLDSVMYRIMEREINRIGAYRAFLFAKEFNRNIDIPLQYGLGRIDSDLKNFIFDYLEAGGNKNLSCYTNYYFRKSDFKEIKIMTIEEIINMFSYDWYKDVNVRKMISNDRMELDQRLVNALANRIVQEELEKEKVKQLRLERKLERSKKL